MTTDDKLTGLNKKLRSYRPGPGNRDELVDNVLKSIGRPEGESLAEKLGDLLFWWTDIIWIRRSLVTASLLLVFVFAFQQFRIVSRIGRLESRMVESNTEHIIRQQGEYILIKSLLRDEVAKSDLRDSITVADRDLRDLINSYTELEKRYDNLKQELYKQQFTGNSNKQKL